MASTNKTTNYELSQFLGTDKPAWLSDYNQDMAKIDTQMKANADGVTSASGTASSAVTSIGNLSSLTTTVKTDLVNAINEVDSNADTAQNTANTASTNASNAISSLQTLENYLNLGTITSYNRTNLTPQSGTLGNSTVKVSRNEAGTLCKIYGVVRHQPTSTGTQTISLNVDTGLRPDTNITITPIGYMYPIYGQNFQNGVLPEELSIIVKTNGYIDIQYMAETIPTNFFYGCIFPCLLFMKDWGDAPTLNQ